MELHAIPVVTTGQADTWFENPASHHRMTVLTADSGNLLTCKTTGSNRWQSIATESYAGKERVGCFILGSHDLRNF